MALIALLINLFTQPALPQAQVETPTSEMEAVFVPAGHVGPIVAAPFTTIVF